MRKIMRTVTTRGRVTIPKQVRQQLGIDTAAKVTFVVDDSGRVELRPSDYQWQDLRSVVPPVPREESVDFKDVFEEAMQRRGDDLMSGRRG